MAAVASFLSATLSAALSVEVQVATVRADIATISTQVNSLRDSVAAFPDSGGSLIEVLAINVAAGNLILAINTATIDTKAVTAAVSGDDANKILADLTNLKPTILDALRLLVAKKPAVASLYNVIDVPALAVHALKALQTAVSALEAALIASAPADFKNKSQPLIDEVDTAFATAIQAFS